MRSVVSIKPELTGQSNPENGTKKEARRGLVIGELLVAFVLLAVAISSLTALMYSVARNPRTRAQAVAVECTQKGSATSPKCVANAKSASGSKLLVAGCATRSGSKIQGCTDSVLSARGSDGTTLRSRTDSASLEMLPKKPVTRRNRTDLGFVR
jgi:hypothetical protein